MIAKVFISHASEDKDRFVLDFAQRLFDKGIDAWVDKWEMMPGDSIVDKIFNEGIKDSKDAIIIVISKYSISKPWVHEEINAAFVKKVTSDRKLIPIILDDAPVPECLASTLWEPIHDTKNYKPSFERIVNSIYGLKDKPNLGVAPVYTKISMDLYQLLNKIDSLVFAVSCEYAIKNDLFSIDTAKIYEKIRSLDITRSEYEESIDILDREGFIKGTRLAGGSIPHFVITIYGMEQYIARNIEDFESIEKRVCYSIINTSKVNIDIAKDLGIPLILVNHVYSLLEQRNLIKMKMMTLGKIYLSEVSPALRRLLDK